MDSSEMRVKKRNGQLEDISFDKILKRIKTIGVEHNISINFAKLCQKIIDQIYDGIPTSQIDELTAEQCASINTQHADYGKLASAIIISNLHKNTCEKIEEIANKLFNFKDIHGQIKPLISNELFEIINDNSELLNSWLDYKRDYLVDYFGYKTLERAYLMKVNKITVERPQHMWLRVAIGIHGTDFARAKETYDYMSKLYFTHATPTLFNAGTPRPQLSSCYLLSLESDSIDGVYNSLKECAQISKWAGGIGLHIHNLRGTGSHIRGTNGTSNGIVPMLRVFNNTARYVDQGGGKRNGSFAIYLEPWHSDIFNFLDLKKNHGDEEMRARDLFYALWIPDLFMKRIKENGEWSLFCPDRTPGLAECYGEEFEKLYTKYEEEEKYVKKVKARDLWFSILDSQMETGTPYLLYKDAANSKSNQQNLGTIKSSNLCTEIIEYSDEKETAVCNLASVSLSKCISYNIVAEDEIKIYSKTDCNYCKKAKQLLNEYGLKYSEIILDDEKIRLDYYNQVNKNAVNPINSVPQIYVNSERIGGFNELKQLMENPQFDFDTLYKIVKIATFNLNKIIDINYYPNDKTRRSNFLHRPIGIGVQGLADAFMILNIPFYSEKAKELNKQIFETIYFASLSTSNLLSIDRLEKMKEIHQINNFDAQIFINKDPHCREYTHFEDSNKDIFQYIKPIRNELNLTDDKLGAYSSFEGSPLSKGLFQFDLWGEKASSRYDWETLRKYVIQYGVRNSLLVAPMPTASTSQILGNNECFEPYTSNIYTRRTLAGEFVIVNKHLMKDLANLELWNEEIKNNIIANKGSIQYIDGIPDELKKKYLIVWEIPMKHLIDMAADRGQFICQSQSMNLWLEDPNYNNLTSMHFYSWQKGLKTGIYYLRRKAKHQPQQFTIKPSNEKIEQEEEHDICEMCSG